MSIVNIKRIYDEPSENDGIRVLVDRIWPRGISKKGSKIDFWAKELAPSAALRKWFDHDPEKFAEFERKYREEIEDINKDRLKDIIKLATEQKVTLIYSARNTRYNQAVVLHHILNEKITKQY